MTELQNALAKIGGLSKTSKMPWYSFSIPATECNNGSKLAVVEGTVCHGCYALKGFYRMHNVQNALHHRHYLLMGYHQRGEMDQWVDAFVTALTLKHKRAKGEDRFRWHDSGDLQGEWHLRAICEVAHRTPFLRHYLPTKEYKIIREFPKSEIPSNLVIRVSHPKIGLAYPDGLFAGLPTTTVAADGAGSFRCPAYSQGGECKSCDACWRSEVDSVDYKVH